MADKVCSFDGCGPTLRLIRGLCGAHYEQQRAGKELHPVAKWGVRGVEECSFDGCARAVHASALKLCLTHAAQAAKGGELRPIRETTPIGGPCLFSGCRNTASAGGLCSAHYGMRNRGEELRPLAWYRGDGREKRDHALRRNYNITAAEYDAMLAAQGGGCAICGRECASGKALAVDHDHRCCPDSATSCGMCVRGLVCARHNMGLGHFEDDVDALRAAADYIERHCQSQLRAA